ncbi:MAG: metal-dependent hydrolase [Candidatus Helarchaeota archaeon]
MGYITYNLYVLAFNTSPNMLGIAIGIVFGLLPDFDVFLVLPELIRRDRSVVKGTKFRHHEFPSHYPLLYSPFILLVIFLPSIITFTMITALYLHLIGDSFCSSNGVQWLAPFSHRYTNFLSSKTQDKHGGYWAQAYQTTIFYKLEFVLLAVALSFFWWNHFYYYHIPTWGLIVVSVSVIWFFLTYLFVERKRTDLFDEIIANAEKED